MSLMMSKIDEVKGFCDSGEYKEALKSAGRILLKPEGIRIYELNRLIDIVQDTTEKSIRKTYANMGSIVF